VTDKPRDVFGEYMASQQYHQALAWTEQDLAHLRITCGELHQETAQAANRLAIARYYTDGPDAAAQAYVDALGFTPPDAHELIAMVLWNLAELAVMQSQPGKARTYLVRAQMHLDQTDDPPVMLIVATLSMRAEAEAMTGNLTLAEDLVLEALAVQKRSMTVDFGTYRSSHLINQLASIHEGAGNVQLAAELRSQLQSITPRK